MAALYNAHGQCPSIYRAKIQGCKGSKVKSCRSKGIYSLHAFAVFASLYLAYKDVGKGREQERKLLREVSLRE